MSTTDTKSLDELLAKKKSTSSKKTSTSSKSTSKSSTNELRSKMDRLKKANEEINSKEKDSEGKNAGDMSALLAEKKQIEKELKETKKSLKDLYSLTYGEVKVIDKKNNALSKEMINELSNPNEGNDQAKIASLEEEKKALNAQIEKLKSDKPASSSSGKTSAASQKKIDALNEKLKESNQALSKANKDVSKAQAKLEELKEANSQLKKDLNKSNNKIEKLNEKKTIVKKVVQASPVSDDERVKKLEQEKEELKKKNEQLNSSLKVANEEIKEYKSNAVNGSTNYEISQFEQENIIIKAEFEKYKQSHSSETEVNEQIQVLNDKVKELTEELKAKETRVKIANLNGESSEEVYKLNQELQDKIDEINKLQDEKKELLKQSNMVDSLKEKIDVLESDLGQKQEEINNLQKMSSLKDSKELVAFKNEYQLMSANIEKVEAEKINLEKELKLAYKSLKEQEEIIEATDLLIAKQQSIIENRLQEYGRQKQMLNSQVNYGDAIELQRLHLELDKANDEINSLVEINKKLTNENNNAKLSLTSYAGGINKNEEHIQELESIIANKNKECQYIFENYQQLQESYNKIKNNREEELQEYKDKINELTVKLQAINFSSEQLELTKYNEQRLMSRVAELENGKKLSSLIDAPSDETAQANFEEYKSLLENEKEANRKSLEKLKADVKSLSKKFDDANDSLEKFSSTYQYAQVAKQVDEVNDLIKDTKSKGTKINRDIYTDYYQKAVEMYEDSKKKYDSEIAKRNDLLKSVKKSLESELDKASAENAKAIKKQIKDIEELLKVEVKVETLDTCDKIEEEILKSFKKDLQSYQKKMKDNISAMGNLFNDKKELKSLGEFEEKHGDQYRQMAFDYIKQIKELGTMNKFENNEFTKFVRDEEILVLMNEFKALTDIRNDRSKLDKNVFVEDGAVTLEEELASSLASFENIKNNLTLKMVDIQNDEEAAKALVYDDINGIKSDITNLNRQLAGLSIHEQDDLVKADIKKVNELIASKNERLEFLQTNQISEIEKLYQSKRDVIEQEFNATIEKEKEAKAMYQARLEAMHEADEANKNRKKNAIDLSKYEEINKYLADIEEVDRIFEAVLDNREQTEVIVRRNEQRKANDIQATKDFIAKYNELWAEYDKLNNVKIALLQEYEEVRSYDIIMLEEAGINKNIAEYSTDIKLANANIEAGNNVSENRADVKVLTNKINALNSRIEFLQGQAKKYLKNSFVHDFKNITKRMDEIIETVKKFDVEIKKIAK